MAYNCTVLQGGKCEITQPFKGIGVHEGIDIVGANYTIDHIVAMEDGIVSEATWCNARGNFVRIDHGNNYFTEYCHMESYSVAVSVGQRVSKGQVIGNMGSTGNSSGGHLDFKIIHGNYNDYIDPTPYVLGEKSFINKLKAPSPVVRDENKRQFQVDCDNTLFIRKSPNGEIINNLSMNKGIYNFTEEKTVDYNTWYKIADNMWCGLSEVSRVLEIISKEDLKMIEQLNKQIEEENAKINDLTSQVKSYENDVTKLRVEITSRDDKINLLEKENANYKEDYNNMKTFIAKETDKYYINLEKDSMIIYNIVSTNNN